MNEHVKCVVKYDPLGVMVRSEDDQLHIADIRGHGASLPQDANGKRIVATWNACDRAGLSNAFLEANGLERMIDLLQTFSSIYWQEQAYLDSKKLLKELRDEPL